MLDITRLRVLEAVARLGSVTAAAKELHYTQPTVSHHLARLEAETGAFSSVIGSLVPRAVAALARNQPDLQIGLTNTQPPEAVELLRTGKIDVAIIFRYDETTPEPDDVRLHHLFDDPLYLLSTRRGDTLATLRDATWIAGCDRCRSHLKSMCADQGFEPRIGYTSDDMVVMQSLVVAGLGVTTSPGLALRAHRVEGIVASELPGSGQHIYAATYGEPPDPPATRALLAALAEAARAVGGVSRQPAAA